MFVQFACTIFLLFLTWLAQYYLFKWRKKAKQSSKRTVSVERCESIPMKRLASTSCSSESYIPEYVPVYRAPENVSSRNPEFKVPAPKFNKSRPRVSRRSSNVSRASLEFTSSSSSDSEDYSDEDLASYPRFKVERRRLIKPTSLSVTQTPSHFRPALEDNKELKKRKRRSSNDREKKRKRRFACESTASVKGATITVKRRKWIHEKTGEVQKKRSLSSAHRTSRRFKVKKIDASALYDPIYDVDCGRRLNSSKKIDASALYDPVYDVDCGRRLNSSLLVETSPIANVRVRLSTK